MQFKDFIYKHFLSRPDAHQVYTMDSNVVKGSRDTLVYKSDRVRSNNTQRPPHQPESQFGTLPGSGVELASFSVPGNRSVLNPTPTPRRLSVCYCYVCSEQLGADASRRIGNVITVWKIKTNKIKSLVCAVKDCWRGTAHLACINMMVPKYQLPLVRSWYYCPLHRAQKEKVGQNF